MRIGLIGGSFNPAHRGPRRMSLAAMEALGLDQVWWLVSPGNPLKPKKGMAPYDARLAQDRGATTAHAAVQSHERRPADQIRDARCDRGSVRFLGET